MVTKEQIIEVVSKIYLPNHIEDIYTENLVTSITIKNDRVGFTVILNKDNLQFKDFIEKVCKLELKKKLSLSNVIIVFTNENEIIDASVNKQNDKSKSKIKIPNIKDIYLISSGKGGVGKSTISVNIALSLAKLGKKVGLLDADILGSSVPRMMGITNQKPGLQNDNMIPVEKYGVKVISVGMMVEEDAVIVWRGPMLAKALHQMLLKTIWGELDILLIDTPPGTGDIHLTIAENYEVSGTIIITTPQDVAVAEAKKTIKMYQKTGIKILGVIENMSYFLINNEENNERKYIFGQDGGKNLAKEFEIPLIEEIPILEEIREAGDKGVSVIEKKDENFCILKAAENIAFMR